MSPLATSLFRQTRSPSLSGSPKPAAKGPAKPERLNGVHQVTNCTAPANTLVRACAVADAAGVTVMR